MANAGPNTNGSQVRWKEREKTENQGSLFLLSLTLDPPFSGKKKKKVLRLHRAHRLPRRQARSLRSISRGLERDQGLRGLRVEVRGHLAGGGRRRVRHHRRRLRAGEQRRRRRRELDGCRGGGVALRRRFRGCLSPGDEEGDSSLAAACRRRQASARDGPCSPFCRCRSFGRPSRGRHCRRRSRRPLRVLKAFFFFPFSFFVLRANILMMILVERCVTGGQ